MLCGLFCSALQEWAINRLGAGWKQPGSTFRAVCEDREHNHVPERQLKGLAECSDDPMTSLLQTHDGRLHIIRELPAVQHSSFRVYEVVRRGVADGTEHFRASILFARTWIWLFRFLSKRGLD